MEFKRVEVFKVSEELRQMIRRDRRNTNSYSGNKREHGFILINKFILKLVSLFATKLY